MSYLVLQMLEAGGWCVALCTGPREVLFWRRWGVDLAVAAAAGCYGSRRCVVEGRVDGMGMAHLGGQVRKEGRAGRKGRLGEERAPPREVERGEERSR